MGERHSYLGWLTLSYCDDAWCCGLLECAVQPNTSVFSTRGFCRGYLTLSSWSRVLPCEHRGDCFSEDPIPGLEVIARLMFA